MQSDIAKQALEGVVEFACRLCGADLKKYRVKFGGGQFAVDWYVSTQNVNASINSKKAVELGLIRRTFGIFGERADSPVVFRIREWDAAKNDTAYRDIWVHPAGDFKARQELAKLLSESITELGPSPE